MKKILLFLDYYDNGGIEKVIESIYNNFKDNYKIDILCFSNNSDTDIDFVLDKKYRNFFIRNIFGLLNLNKYFSGRKYDIIHINCYNSFGLVYASFMKKYCSKIIIHAHNSGIDRDKFKIKLLINNLIKILFNKNYILIGNSKSSSKFCFGMNTDIIYNGIDYDKYRFSNELREKYREELNIQNKKVICHIGRFEGQKNHKFIIDIFNDILKVDDSFYLILIGDGLYFEEIKKMVWKLGIESHVLFIKRMDDVYKLYSAVDIYVHPSIYEGFGLTCVEAQINERIVLLSEFIEEDIVISNNAYRLKLEKKKWVDKILNVKRKQSLVDNKFKIENFFNKIKAYYDV